VSCVAVSVSALEFNMERAASKLCASLWAIIMSSHNRAKRDRLSLHFTAVEIFLSNLVSQKTKTDAFRL